jgi:hypothetical protein
MPMLNFIHPITFIISIIRLFISTSLEIIIAKEITEKFGIEKKAKWTKAILISTFLSIITNFIVRMLLTILLIKLSVRTPHFLSFSLILPDIFSIFAAIILRVLTYSIASLTWKTLPFKKKLLFCFYSFGIVNLLLFVLQKLLPFFIFLSSQS